MSKPTKKEFEDQYRRYLKFSTPTQIVMCRDRTVCRRLVGIFCGIDAIALGLDTDRSDCCGLLLVLLQFHAKEIRAQLFELQKIDDSTSFFQPSP